jgi:hypothetical protein
MKKTILLAAVAFLSLGAFAQTKVDDVVKLNIEKYDFGKIKQGVPVSYSFEIKNISKAAITVENSWASCGCTTPEKITEPIAPGATAKLKVQYNAAAVAPFTKDVSIKFAGVDEVKVVKITGEVLSTEAWDAALKAAPATPAAPPAPKVLPMGGKEAGNGKAPAGKK